MVITDGKIEYEINKTFHTAIVLGTIDDSIRELYIPSMVQDCVVLKIQSEAFCDCKNLSIAELPDSIVKVGSKAFANCTLLNGVKFVKSDHAQHSLKIGGHAFYNCSNLRHFIVCNDNIHVSCSNAAFKNCRQLYHCSCSLDYLDINVFENCFELDNLTFAPNVLWRTTTFKGCHNLKHLTFLEDVDERLSNTCIEWLKRRKIKACSTNSIFPELVLEGASIEFIKKP